ncbi:hypothetical protein CHLRE_06g278298v5 [Chlamydomonas reinhardtii]|uniref:Uncharacterized protein n=1 Tax=Chlamydomonas reinhardtii TaxID=3055 RepID=A0A2K3DPF3_CHLRE|nr:uncharacterized protein CHLRE_06g278298v5 [Chlamydomonas reinhardtii]PNW82415.1 hypothetical protein CHLRE_06g278298v5 [Chlamydomonas reinhardtii]
MVAASPSVVVSGAAPPAVRSAVASTIMSSKWAAAAASCFLVIGSVTRDQRGLSSDVVAGGAAGCGASHRR